MNKTIKIEQALHGYGNGHQLIASSVDLNIDDKRLMDELSDLSGICEEKRFVDYYTGYPISNGEKYVIARTWYAFEKQRPGCVWTHSLILNTEDVGKISCMKSFEKLFVRPDGNDYRRYVNTILYQNIGEDNLVEYNAEKLQYIIYTLFSSEKSKYVGATEIQLENEVLFMLKILPRRLIQQFSFCTMAYNVRKIGNEEFSYQIVDKVKQYKIERKTEKRHICEDFSVIKRYPLWISEYYKYIWENRLYLLHDFMEQYGELYLDFSNYSAMARLYFAAKSTENITLEEYFKYADIVRNQTDIFFYNRTIELILDEHLKIFVGKEYEIWKMLELKKIKLKNNYQKKLNEKTIRNTPEKIYPILQKYIEGKLSSNTKRVVEKMIMELKPEQLKKVSKMDENICMVLVRQNEGLILAKDIWKESKKFQQMILSVSNKNLSEEILKSLIYVIVKYDKESISESLFTIYGERIIPYVYEAIKKENFDKNVDIENWMTVLLENQKKLLENILCFSRITIIKKILLTIDTYQDQYLYAIDGESWKTLYKKIQENEGVDENLAIQFLPVALKTDYLDEVLVQIISPIYKALKNNSMAFEQWNRIQVLLPEVEAYQSWDRCLRIRLALEKKGISSL